MRYFSIIIIAIILMFSGCSREQQSVHRIAYVGRYTNAADTTPQAKQTPNQFDVLHERILRQYIEEFNATSTGNKLELVTFDCQRSAHISDSVYQRIVADTTIIAAIDNTWGVHLAGAQQRIRDAKLPLIAMNADHNGMDFGPASIFSGNSDAVPFDLATYIDSALAIHSVNFLYEQDYALTAGYFKAFEQHHIGIRNSIALTSAKVLHADSLKAACALIESLYKQHPEEKNQLLVLNVHSNWGNELLSYLDKHLNDLHIIGHAYIANGNALEGFGAGTTNELILITNPTDAMTRKAHLDLESNRRREAEVFSNLNAPLFVKRCIDAMAFVRAAIEESDNSSAKNKDKASSSHGLSRESMRGSFHALRGRTIAGVDDLYTLDSTGVVVPDLTFSRYTQGKLFSMPKQLNNQRSVIPNLVFGMEIQDIYDLNVSSNSFTADFYYWVKMDSINRDAEKYISFQNMKSSQSNRELIIENHDGGSIYKLYRVSGSFYVNYKLEDFPFDKQELAVNVEILSADDHLKISFDQSALMLDSTTMAKFKVTGWAKKSFYLTVDNNITRGNKGDPKANIRSLKKFKNFAFHLGVERIVLGSFLQIVLPLVLIGLIAIALLFIRDLSFENVGEVSVGIFLSIIAFSISLSSMIPSSNYLTRADTLFWLTFLVVFASFMTIIVLNSLYDHDQVKRYRLVRFGTALAVVYPLMVAWVLWH